MKRLSLFLLLILLAGAVFAQPAQPPTCTDPDNQQTCTVLDAYKFYRDAALKKLGIDASTSAAKVDQAVANSNRATTAPDAFAGRVHNSYQDFLNLFSFAINKVDESTDGQALTVRFNPIRSGAQLLGFTVTAAKPAVSGLVTGAVPEAGRTDVAAKLAGKLTDLDDVTVAGSYSLQSLACAPSPTAGRCYGRSMSTYRDILSRALGRVFNAGPGLDDLHDHQVKLLIFSGFTQVIRDSAPNGNLFGLTIGVASQPSQLRQQLRDLADADAQQTVAAKAFFSKQNLDVVTSMIDNQPQFALTGSYRSPGKYGGPKQTALSAELQFGTDNINALRADCDHAPDADACLGEKMSTRLKNGVSTNKVVVTATFTRDDRYRLADLGLTGVMGFMPVDQKSTSELIVKGQGGRQLGALIGTQNMRGDLSIEGHRVQNDHVRTTNRWVAVGTLTLPLGDNMSVPVSITYANKPEFLVDQKAKVSAHLGISYRLPMRPAVAAN